MPYSNISSRAGLVVLAFALSISLVSAVPIPATASSELSSTFSPHSNLCLFDDSEMKSTSGRMSTFATRPTLKQDISTNMVDDDQLVRRGIGAKIKAAFHKASEGVKKLDHKIDQGIKHVAEKIGQGVKHVVQKVETGVKHAAQVVATGVKKAAGKVWNVAKKVIKVGGEIYRTGLRIVSKVVGAVLPGGLGKVVGKAMDGVAEAVHQVTKRINVPLPSKMQKGMNVLGKINGVMNKMSPL